MLCSCYYVLCFILGTVEALSPEERTRARRAGSRLRDWSVIGSDCGLGGCLPIVVWTIS